MKVNNIDFTLRRHQVDKVGAIFPLVISAGISRSGSTWIYNAILNLLRAGHQARGRFENELSENLLRELRADVTWVVKCHRPTRGFLNMAQVWGLPVFLSVRDPRDCVTSLMRQFGLSFEESLKTVAEDFEACQEIYFNNISLIIRYESGVGDFNTLKNIANYLNIRVDGENISIIHKKLQPSCIRKTIEDIYKKELNLENKSVEEEYLKSGIASRIPEAQWHPNHIGPGEVGGYRDYLSSDQLTEIRYRLSALALAMGYDLGPLPPAPSRCRIEMVSSGRYYRVRGFSEVEPWGFWTDGEHAQLSIPLVRAVNRVRVRFSMMVSPCFLEAGSEASGEITLNGQKIAQITNQNACPDLLVECVADIAPADYVQIAFEFKNLKTPRRVNGAGDDRMLARLIHSVPESGLADVA